jgi:spore coat protein U-like protein
VAGLMGDRFVNCSCLRSGAALLGAILWLAPTPVQAGGRATQTTQVVLNVSHSCRLSTNTLNFGVVNTNAKTVRASTTMTLNCTPGTIYTIGIDNGQKWDGTTRRMHNDQAEGQVFYADYALYRDPLYALPWGSGVSGSYAGTLGPSGSQTLTVYGEAQLKNVRSSGYIDTVTVVLDF